MAGTAPKPKESAIQKAVRDYLTALQIDSIAIPNGSVLAGDRTQRFKQMAALKRTGLVPGAADLILLDRRDGPRVGFFEVKREGTYQTPEQKAFQVTCRDVWAVPYAVVRCLHDVTETLSEWGWR